MKPPNPRAVTFLYTTAPSGRRPPRADTQLVRLTRISVFEIVPFAPGIAAPPGNEAQ